MDFYSANDDVLKGYQSLTVLDGKTSDICISYSGSKYDINFKPIGNSKPYRPTPRHFRCRSTHIPILKTWRELGIDEDELPTGTQSSDAGYLPQDYTFNDFLKTKTKEYQNDVLGVGRAQLWRDGKITLSQLVNQQGRSLSLKELKAISGEAVSVAKAVKVPDISFGYGGKFDGYVKDIRAEAKMVIDRLPKPKDMVFVKANEKKRVGSYNPDTQAMRIQKDSNRNIVHEYGHHIDNITKKDIVRGQFTLKQIVSDDIRFKDAFDIYKEQYRYTNANIMTNIMEKNGIDKHTPLVDVFDAFTEGKMSSAKLGGHGATYFESSALQRRETFAHLFQSWSQNDKWDTYQNLFPKLSDEFEKIMKDIIDGKFD